MKTLLCLVIFLIYQVVGHMSEILGSSANSVSSSEIRQNFADECESMIEDQVVVEYEAGYFYQHYANYFKQYDVALLGFSAMFQRSAEEEREHAQLLIDYVYKRGGKVNLKAIRAPGVSASINTPIKIVNEALNKERDVNSAILKLYNCSNSDPHFQAFLDDSLISEQVESIHDLGILLSRLRRCAVATHTVPICEHMIDNELLAEYAKK